ncbi:MAG: DUF2628 domain-containing protein [candidate division KSB1 bacterium]|nr:DUF2628 domain-containing protein [candidate division KSB1 bacterium]
MREYKIFEHPNGRIEAVKQGWSWPAFFLTAWWALYKKMWWVGGTVFAVYSIVWLIAEGPGNQLRDFINSLASLGGLVLGVVFGVNGNRWHEKNLRHRGYRSRATVTAPNPEAAIAIFLVDIQGHGSQARKTA